MLLLNIILIIIIISGSVYLAINHKNLQQQIKEDYLNKNRAEFNKQLQNEKQIVEDNLLLQIASTKNELADVQRNLSQAKEQLSTTVRAGEETIRQLDQRKKEQLSAISEIVNERKQSIDTDVAAYKEVEMQKARTAVHADTQAEQKWAEATLSTYWDGLAQTTQKKEQELAEVVALLDDYKKKQQVINEAILRQRAIDEQQDFYRVCLSQETIEDVQILQNVRQKLHFSESLNKLIYDVYISKPAKEMIKRVLGTSDPSGVYKITRLKTGEVYIGQAVHLPDRWQQHLKTVYGAGTIARSMLHTTMQKDGVENFTFEMIEEVPKEKLREREKYWIDFYQSKSYGMNERNG